MSRKLSVWMATPPMGYHPVHVHEGRAVRKRLEIDPNWAPIVERIFQESLEGRGAKEIAIRLNDDGLCTRRGQRWLD